MNNYKIHIYRLLVVLFILSAISQIASSQSRLKLSNPKSTLEARALYSYLTDMYGKKMLSGQMWTGWRIDEIKYVFDSTGKYPAICGVDFIHERENDAAVKKAIDWWKSGGIPTIMWHMGAPGIGEGYENSKKSIEIDKCFEKGTPEYTAFWTELKSKGDLLERLNKEKVPVLWRPFHELNGDWFWWGKQGPEKFKRLWITMYDYYVKERKLNNLIWVLCFTGQPDADWYPGDKYVDIAGADTYARNDSPQPLMYNKVKDMLKPGAPIAFHECGIPPNPDKCLATNVMWSWWMEWHTQHLRNMDKKYMKYVYLHDAVITKDEIPDLVKVYKGR